MNPDVKNQGKEIIVMTTFPWYGPWIKLPA